MPAPHVPSRPTMPCKCSALLLQHSNTPFPLPSPPRSSPPAPQPSASSSPAPCTSPAKRSPLCAETPPPSRNARNNHNRPCFRRSVCPSLIHSLKTVPGTLRDGGASFATTHWSVIARSALTDVPEAADALAQLCEMYWPPIYSFV